jgi:hypothetical protein
VEIQELHRYAKDVETLFRFFSDPPTIKAKFEGIGARNIQVLESSEQGGVHLTRTQREMPAEVPGILKKFFGEWNKVVQTEHWRREGSSRTCEFQIDVSGAPVKMHGTMQLRPEGEGCVNDVKLDITSGVPLLGKKIVELVAATSRKGMAAEYAYIRAHL